jgi:hypothetical protein
VLHLQIEQIFCCNRVDNAVDVSSVNNRQVIDVNENVVFRVFVIHHVGVDVENHSAHQTWQIGKRFKIDVRAVRTQDEVVVIRLDVADEAVK